MTGFQLKIGTFILCLLPAIAAADIYRWTDETGKTHYSDKAPPGIKAEKKEYVNVATPWRKLPKPTPPPEEVGADKKPSGMPVNSAESENAKAESDGELSTDKKDKKNKKKTKRLKADAGNSSSGPVKLDQKDKSSSTPAKRITDIKKRNTQAKKDYNNPN